MSGRHVTDGHPTTAEDVPASTLRVEDLDTLESFFAAHRRVLVLTGAGISTSSGIPDYRDTKGHWKRGHPIQHAPFMADRSTRQRYWARSFVGWPAFAAATPNAAHRALATLEAAGHIHYLVTQNVDGLHQRAGNRRVLDLHGRLDLVDCQSCGRRYSRQVFQQRLAILNPGFAPARASQAPDGDAIMDEAAVRGFAVPACDQCGGILKPNVVFFGGAVPAPRQKRALDKLGTADALLVIGSSLMVFSGYRLVRDARTQGKAVAVLTLGRTRADAEINFKVNADCTVVLPRLTRRLLATSRAG